MTRLISRRLVGVVAAPVAAAGVVAGALGVSAVANASATPGVNTRTSGMTLSREYIAQQKAEHGSSGSAMDLQAQQEQAQPDSPFKQEHSELKGDLKAGEVKEAALKTVESQENDQTQEPKAHTYTLKNPVHKKLGLMKAGWSQMAR